jgi:intergrase/recombinase
MSLSIFIVEIYALIR